MEINQTADARNASTITHPDYDSMMSEWLKFRDVLESGHAFVEKYLKLFSVREDATDFKARKEISYCPAHAKSALIDIKNSIYSRLVDINRSGEDNYIQACQGLNGGVDRKSNTMNAFVGRDILSELLAMAKVGVFVDRAPIAPGATKADTVGKNPYLYLYKAEDIRSWYIDENLILQSLLLRDHTEIRDEKTGLVTSVEDAYRLLRMVDGKVEVTFYDKAGKDDAKKPKKILELNEIPFVLFEISHSLLKDVADYQIALTNMASGDLNYGLKANFPFYTEQFDPGMEAANLRSAQAAKSQSTDPNVLPGTDGRAASATASKNKEMRVGTTQGRRYPKNLERPGFIHPSAEPLTASLEHRETMKKEIRQLINLSLSNLDPKRASAESKKVDEEGLESGLSYIGLELEHGERRICEIWHKYLGDKNEITIKYPTNYSLKSSEDFWQEADNLQKLLPKLPSLTFQKAVAKRIMMATVAQFMSQSEIEKSKKEIDDAKIIVIDREVLTPDIENGLLSPETASKAVGYPDDEYKKAEEARAKRAAAIALAQSKVVNAAARGVKDLSADPSQQAKDEKAQVDLEKAK